jgi:hypothetical protein
MYILSVLIQYASRRRRYRLIDNLPSDLTASTVPLLSYLCLRLLHYINDPAEELLLEFASRELSLDGSVPSDRSCGEDLLPESVLSSKKVESGSLILCDCQLSEKKVLDRRYLLRVASCKVFQVFDKDVADVFKVIQECLLWLSLHLLGPQLLRDLSIDVIYYLGSIVVILT